MTDPRARWLAPLLLVALAVPAAQAHGTVEAQELEVHVLNDEGSDVIEAYGGYDITDALLGSAYLPEFGDLVYLRLDLYGLVEQHTATMPWTVRITYTTPSGLGTHTLATTDGVAFEHDFLLMESELDVEEHTLHIQRAYLTSGAPAPGQPLRDLRVESYWGDDLRDVAPGGIPAPVLGAEYPEPTAIEGQGVLEQEPVPAPTEAYFGVLTATRDGATYTVTVANGLRGGGQHVLLSSLDASAPGWTQTVEAPAVVLEANGTGAYSFQALADDPAAAPLMLQFVSDVGGRLAFEVHPDGSLWARGAEVLPAAQPPAVESPGAPFAVLVVALLGLVLGRRA